MANYMEILLSNQFLFSAFKIKIINNETNEVLFHKEYEYGKDARAEIEIVESLESLEKRYLAEKNGDTYQPAPYIGTIIQELKDKYNIAKKDILLSGEYNIILKVNSEKVDNFYNKYIKEIE